MSVRRKLPSVWGYLFSALSVVYFFLYTQGYSLLFRESQLLFGCVAIIGIVCGLLREICTQRWRSVFDAIWLTVLFSFFPIPGQGLSLILIFCAVLFLSAVLAEHFMTIIAWTAAAFCIAMAFTPLRIEAAPVLVHPVPVQITVPILHPQLPPVVHLILDEHEGMIGLSTQTMSVIKALAKQHGLTLYPNAYSRYSTTLNSIPNLVNFSEIAIQDGYVLNQGHDPHLGGSLQKNRYFSELTKAGYQIHVYQPAYLDYCHSDVQVKSCRTYPALFANVVATSSLPLMNKFNFLIARGLFSSSLVKSMSELYFTTLRPYWLQTGWAEPTWLMQLHRTTALTSLSVLHGVAQDIAHSPRGSVYFFHMMLPHSPYVYTSDCQLKPHSNDWDINIDAPPILNTKASVQRRTADYEQQVQCVAKQVGQFLTGLEQNPQTRDAIILIHGDHGSRIVYQSPDVGNRSHITAFDQVNAFATLFAVKAPGHGEIAPTAFTPITLIFNDIVHHWLQVSLPRQRTGNYVYLTPADIGADLQPMPVDQWQWYLAVNKDYG
jgi:hypothetical protein